MQQEGDRTHQLHYGCAWRLSCQGQIPVPTLTAQRPHFYADPAHAEPAPLALTSDLQKQNVDVNQLTTAWVSGTKD